MYTDYFLVKMVDLMTHVT